MAYYHLAELVHEQAKKYKHKTAIKFQGEKNGWENLSWEDFSSKIMKIARAMAEWGVEPEDNIGIYSQNMEKYLITDFGAYANRAVMVPMYATASPSQIDYIIKEAEIKLIFVGEQFQYNNAYKVQQMNPSLSKIVIFDNKVVLNSGDTTSVYFDNFIATGENSQAEALVNVRLKQAKETDLATIIYTSGTTGEPKGVMLTHECYIQTFKNHDLRLKCSDKDLSMCFLPLTHIFEKGWTYYCLHKGICVATNREPVKIQEMLRQVRPTLMCSVPRFWEKVYEGVKEKMDNAKGALKWLFEDAVKTGKIYHLDYRNRGKKAPIGNTIKFFLYKYTVFNLVKKTVGIERGRFFPVAGAPLSDSINEFMQCIDVQLCYGYGLSETTATVSCFPSVGFKIGTVGKVMPGVEVKIGDNNEILIKGKTIMKGYYKKPEATAEVLTEDGFFRSGDAGLLTENNEIILTDRLKDLYKTSNGKYIAPQMIETRIAEDKYIDQIVVIGNERKFVSALIVPNFEFLEAYAREHNIPFQSREELVANEEIYNFMYGRVEMKQTDFTNYEKIKRFTLLAKAFSMDDEELTNTLKIKRKVAIEHNAELVDKMYQE